ncbi:reverse transcriptase domain-containing protein [Tanacetum coccineum]
MKPPEKTTSIAFHEPNARKTSRTKLLFSMASGIIFSSPIDPKDQEKTTFTCSKLEYFAYRAHAFWAMQCSRGRSTLQEEQVHTRGCYYLFKMVEAKALFSHHVADVFCKFLKTLFSRFGAPRAIISDRGTHFCNDQFTKVMLKYGVTHRLSTAVITHKTSGTSDVSNRDYPDVKTLVLAVNPQKFSTSLASFRESSIPKLID